MSNQYQEVISTQRLTEASLIIGGHKYAEEEL